MANQDNGYMNYGDDSESDFKRKCDANKDIPLSDEEDVDGGVGGGKMPKANEYYVKELLSERVQIEGKYPHADRLLQQGKMITAYLLNVFIEFLFPQKSVMLVRMVKYLPETSDMWTFTMRSPSR